MFGAHFITQHGPVPNRMWLRAIHSLTDEQVAVGLDSIMQNKREFAPNVTEFTESCRFPNGRTAGPRFLGVPSLTEPKHDRAPTEVAQGWLSRIRGRLT